MGNVFGREEPPPPPPPPVRAFNFYEIPTYEYYHPRPLPQRPPPPVRINHAGPAMPATPALPALPALRQAQKPKRPCRFFAQGHCRKGAACTFLHDATSTAEMKAKKDLIDPDSLTDTWMRVIGDAWVQFGDGAAVADVSFLTDFSSVRISNLPGNSTLTSVSDMLQSVGIAVSSRDIRLIRPPAGKATEGSSSSSAVAIVKKKDPGFAQVACRKLRTLVNLPHLEVAPAPVTNTQATVFRQVDSRRVRCSWHKPTRTASLSFGSRPTAMHVANKFRSGQYKVGQTKVMASLPPVDVTGEGQPTRWAITLSGLAAAVQEADITGSIKATAHQPRSIQIGGLNYVADAEVDAVFVRSMVDAFGALERWDMPSTNKGQGKRINAHATFVDAAHAQAAAKALNGQPLPFCPTSKLFVQALTSVRFKVSTRVFDAVQTRIDQQKRASWDSQHVGYFAFPASGFYRVLRLEGEQRQALSEARKQLEAIVGGDVVIWAGKELWHDDLRLDRVTLRRLRRIETDLGVVITREVQASRFRVYGPREQYNRAAQALHQLIEDTRARHTISLKRPGELEWARDGGGIAVLTAELGPDKIAFDETAQSIAVRGSDQDLAAAKLIVARRQTKPLKLKPKPGNSPDTAVCPICFCEPEDPVSTACGHIYCGACFVNMCEAAATAETARDDLCIRCVGAGGQCRAVLPMSQIHSILLAESFENLLEASFDAFVRRRPDQFRRCPTADCTQIYRTAKSDGAAAVSPIFTCTLCLVSICTACHAAHPGKTCAEHQGDASGGLAALVKIKEELGIQDCPKCATSMERTGGCNHMTCKGCGSHICWKCLSIVDRDEIYNHMNKLHGNWYD